MTDGLLFLTSLSEHSRKEMVLHHHNLAAIFYMFSLLPLPWAADFPIMAGEQTTYQPRNRPIGGMFQHRNGVIPLTAGFLRFLLVCLCLISVSQQKGDQTMNNTIATTLLCGPAAIPPEYEKPVCSLAARYVCDRLFPVRPLQDGL